MDRSTTIVNEGLELGGELNAALRKISNVVTEVYKFAQEIGARPPTSSRTARRRLRARHHSRPTTKSLTKSTGSRGVGRSKLQQVKAMERMRELVQSSTSGSTNWQPRRSRCRRCRAACWNSSTALPWPRLYRQLSTENSGRRRAAPRQERSSGSGSRGGCTGAEQYEP